MKLTSFKSIVTAKPFTLLFLFLSGFFSSRAFSQDLPAGKMNLRQLDSITAIRKVNWHGLKNRPPHGFTGSSNNNIKNFRREILSRPDKSAGIANCYDTSGKFSLLKDSATMYTNYSYRAKDGNLLLAGEYYNFLDNGIDCGFLMKCDENGNVLWTKIYDSINSVQHGYTYYYRVLELNKGDILMAGGTYNNVSKNNDLIITKTDNYGNIIWSKTYKSRLWQPGGSGSGDYFYAQQVKEDPFTGDIYLTGPHWSDGRNITKLDTNNGNILWSKYYETPFEGYFDRVFGLDIRQDKIVSIGAFSNYNAYIGIYVLDKTTGDTIMTRFLNFPDASWSKNGFLTSNSLCVLNDGSYALGGELFGYYQYMPNGTPYYQAGVVKLDSNFNFINAYCFRNTVESNSYNTDVTLYPDGSGLFTMLKVHSGYTADQYFVQFKNVVITKQRKKSYIGEGIPVQPETIKTLDGGDLDIKLIGDSANNVSKIEFLKLHTSDTSSACIGIEDHSTFIEPYYLQPLPGRLDSIGDHDFQESTNKTLSVRSIPTTYEAGCVQTSHCDSLQIKSSQDTICSSTPLYITFVKNKECGSAISWDYDSSEVQSFTPINDSTIRVLYKGSWQGTIYAGLYGCSVLQDSLKVTVLETPLSLNLGPDSVICPGNTLQLNARKGFASYQWQDGSSDSVYNVTKPGTYFVKAVGACGDAFYDTVTIAAHPPIPFNAGPDRTKCNNDTLHIHAPAGFISYQWTPDYYISSVTDSAVIVSAPVDTLYRVMAEKTPGCFAYDSVRVTVSHSPLINLGRDTSFCNGDSLILNAGNAFTAYQWNTGNITQTIIARSAGNYYVQATTLAGCSSYDILQVLQVFNKPVISLDKDSTLCAGTSRILNAGNFASYLWNNGSTASGITVHTTGLFSVIVTDANGCTNADSVSIKTILPSPAEFLPADTSVCSYGTLQIQPTGGYMAYLWSNSSMANHINVTGPGVYWLQVADKNNCTGRDSIVISEKQCLAGFYIPNAFTPNNDGRNDTFKPLLFGNIDSYIFTVYNRFGQKVFESSDISKGWDGIYKGMLQDSNVFLWICRYNFKGNTIKTERGSVMLIK